MNWVALQIEIEARLRDGHGHEYSAGELAFLLPAAVIEVNSALGALVREKRIERIHLSDGTLRYKRTPAGQLAFARKVAEIDWSDAKVERKPAPARPARSPSRPMPCSIGVNLDILVDSVLHDIDNIMASDAKPTARAEALDEINQVLRGHLERVAVQLLSEEVASS